MLLMMLLMAAVVVLVVVVVMVMQIIMMMIMRRTMGRRRRMTTTKTTMETMSMMIARSEYDSVHSHNNEDTLLTLVLIFGWGEFSDLICGIFLSSYSGIFSVYSGFLPSSTG